MFAKKIRDVSIPFMQQITLKEDALNKIDTLRVLDLSARLRGDKDIVLPIVSRDGDQLQYASFALQKNKQVVLAAIQSDPVNGFLHAKLYRKKTNKKLILLVYKLRSDTDDGDRLFDKIAEKLKYSSILNDHDVMKSILTYSGTNLQFFNEHMRDNENVVEIAIRQNPFALQFASERLRDDNFLVHKAVCCTGKTLQYGSDRLKNTYGIAKCAIENDGLALEFVSSRLKNEYCLVQKAIENDGYALKYANKRLKDIDSLVHKAIANEPNHIYSASKRLQTDLNTIILLFNNHPEFNFKWIGSTLGDLDFMTQFYDAHPNICIRYIRYPLYHNDHFLYHIFTHNPLLWEEQETCKKQAIRNMRVFNEKYKKNDQLNVNDFVQYYIERYLSHIKSSVLHFKN